MAATAARAECTAAPGQARPCSDSAAGPAPPRQGPRRRHRAWNIGSSGIAVDPVTLATAKRVEDEREHRLLQIDAEGLTRSCGGSIAPYGEGQDRWSSPESNGDGEGDASRRRDGEWGSSRRAEGGDCLNHPEEDNDNPEGADIIGYEEPDSVEPTMASSRPGRNVKVKPSNLSEYDGGLADILRAMLLEFGCDPQIQVMKYWYYDGPVLEKCRVGLRLPESLGMSVVMPAGEARTINTAYHIAIMRAITDIREHKTKELMGSKFAHIPHMEEEDDPMLNHFKLAKHKPAEAAKYMDNSRNLLSLFFQLNRHLSGAIDTMLEEFTEPKEETKGKEPMENEVHTPVYSAGDYISIDHPEQQTTPITPRYFPSSSHGGYEGGEESGNNQRSVTPIENSTGWRWGSDTGTHSDSVRYNPVMNEDATTQNQNYQGNRGDEEGYPILIESDTDGGYTYGGVTGEYTRWVDYDALNDQFMNTDFSLGSSSDSDYQPTGRPYVPDSREDYTFDRMEALDGDMSGLTGEESEAQRIEREAKQKEEADEAARNQFPPPPPPMTQQNFLQYMQMLEEKQRMTMEQQNKFFQELLQQNRVERPENQGVTLSDFQNTKPISFAYAPEPMDAEDWLMDTERKLNTVGCNDLEKVRYATHLLCGPAVSWWDNIVAVYPAEKVFTWEEFKRKFRESNVPESIVELKRREFESLEQKDKAILTYVREFSKLSRMMRATEFQELVDAAITLEDDFKQLQEEKRKKAKFEPKRYVSNKPNTGLSFKPRYNNYYNNNQKRNQGSQPANQIFCRSCGKPGHVSKDCKRPRIICFGCREEGHMLRDFPKNKNVGGQSGGGGSLGGNTGGNWKNKKPFGKLNCTSLEEVVNSDQAVIGSSKEFNPDYVKEKQQIIDIIRDRLKIAQSRQKSYADQKRRTWEPQVGDMVYLKATLGKSTRNQELKNRKNNTAVQHAHTITASTQAPQACKEEQGKHKLNTEEILYTNKQSRSWSEV
ncbi:hypothetical protein QYE76_060678 [Lolium multiflorum]|uniref:CCHC-type domain-containing protein n=1 Tax=Lolium multiflorum TaxID=4521 RepID=A0AAD8W4I3_LOLMU|nr:hypothetical protein QYE76_060678 [Lolium multiflorum]